MGEKPIVWPPSRPPLHRRKAERNRLIVHQVMDLGIPRSVVALEHGISPRRVSQIINTPKSWR